MTSRISRSLVTASFGAALAVVAFAQNASTPHSDTGSKSMMKSLDTKFAMTAAQGSLAEIQTGQLATQKASSADVKAFGQQMIDDHTKANDQLKTIASAEGMTLPTDLDPKHSAMYTKLQGLSGAQFDHAYVMMMTKDHLEDVKEFQKEANAGKDPQIKSFAAQTLPIVQGHLDKIKGIQSSMGSGSSSKM